MFSRIFLFMDKLFSIFRGGMFRSGMIKKRLVRYSPIFALVLSLAGFFGIAACRYVEASVVFLDGREIGVMKDYNAFAKSVEDAQSAISRQLGVKVLIDRDRFHVEQKKTSLHKIASSDRFKKILTEASPVLVSARTIQVDGTDAVTVYNDTLVKELFDYYKKDEMMDGQYDHVGFAGEVAVRSSQVSPTFVQGYHSALNVLEASQALVVETQEWVTYQEEVPFEEVVEASPDMLQGTRELVVRGRPGQKVINALLVKQNGEEVRREIIAEEITLKPVTQKIDVGTKSFEELYFTGVLDWPKYGNVTSRYGSRWESFHSGIDIAGNTGDAIYAADGGEVVFAGWDGGYGYLIKLAHVNGLVTWYGHCSKIYVEEGEQVKKGDVIGAVGSTGFSTGPHLHFEVRKYGVSYDPFNYLD